MREMKKVQIDLSMFVALMGTLTLAISSKLIFDNSISNSFAYLLEISSILIYTIYFFKFLIHVFNKSFVEALKDPSKSSLYSSSAIAAALISLALLQVGIPGSSAQIINSLSVSFWAISLFFSLFFVIVIPISLKFRAKPEQVTGIWFLPSASLFVLISAGSIIALKIPSLTNLIILLNSLVFGPAFVLYFLTLTLVYYRSKFYPINEKKITPTFNIVLAPVAVSILAVISMSKLFLKNDVFGFAELFVGISKLYSIMMFGYGLWVLAGLILLYLRILKEHKSIPFSQLWWAFVFPIGAFTLATVNLYHFILSFVFIKYIYYTLYAILLLLWLQVFTKQISLKIKKRENQ